MQYFILFERNRKECPNADWYEYGIECKSNKMGCNYQHCPFMYWLEKYSALKGK